MAPDLKADGPEILAKFQAFDLNRDGQIDRQELGRVLQAIDREAWTPDRLNKLFRVVANAEGKICYEEFVAWALGNGAVETRDLNNFRRAVRGKRLMSVSIPSQQNACLAGGLVAISETQPVQMKATQPQPWVRQPCSNGVQLVDSAPGSLIKDFAIVPNGGIFTSAIEVELLLSIQCNVDMYQPLVFRGAGLFYSLDGSEPSPEKVKDETTLVYENPFKLSRCGEHFVNAIARLPSGEVLRTHARFVICYYTLPKTIVSGVARAVPKLAAPAPEASPQEVRHSVEDSPDGVRTALGLDSLILGGSRDCLASVDKPDASITAAGGEARLQIQEELSAIASAAAPGRCCTVKLGVVRKFWISTIWEHGDWLQVRCRFLKPWRGWLKNISQAVRAEELSSALRCEVQVLRTVPGQNGQVNVQLELRPINGKSSGRSLATALQQLLQDVRPVPRLEEEPDLAEAFGTPGGIEEQHLREVASPAFVQALHDGLCTVLPGITEVVLPDGGVRGGDGEGIVIEVAVQSAQRPMARSDFFDSFTRSPDSQRIFAQAVLQAVGQVDRSQARWRLESHCVFVEECMPADVKRELGVRYFVEIPPTLENPSPQLPQAYPPTSPTSAKASSAGWGMSARATNANASHKSSALPVEAADKVVALLNSARHAGKYLTSARASALRHVHFEVCWDYPAHGKDFIDCSSLAYADSCLLQLVDYRAGDEADGPWGAPSICIDGTGNKLELAGRCDLAGLCDGVSDEHAEHEQLHKEGDKEKADDVPRENHSGDKGEAERLDKQREAEGDKEEPLSEQKCLPNGRLAPPRLPGLPKHIQQTYPHDVRCMWKDVRTAVRHSGDVMDDTAATGKHVVQVDLALLPHSVSRLFFVLSAHKCEDLSLFPRRSVRMTNAEFPEHQLTECDIDIPTSSQACVACFLSKSLGPWILERVCTPCQGNVMNYDPIFVAARLAASL